MKQGRLLIFTILALFSFTQVVSCDPFTLDGDNVYGITQGPVPEVIILQDDATLIISGIQPETLTYNDTQEVKISVYDNSRVILTNSSLHGYIHLYNSSSLEMNDSSFFYAYWCSGHHMFHNGSGVFAYDSSTINIIDSKLGYLRGYKDASGVISGSDIMEIRASASQGDTGNVTFHIKNSEVGNVHLIEVDKPLTGYVSGGYKYLVFDQIPGQTIILDECILKRGISVTSREKPMIISDSDVFVASSTNGSQVDISDSYLWDLVVWNPKGVTTINRCKVDYFNALFMIDAVLNVDNTEVKRFVAFDDYTLYSSNTTIHNFYQGSYAKMVLSNCTLLLQEKQISSLEMEGEFNMYNVSLPSFGSWYHNVTIKRLYPVMVTRNHIPVNGAKVQLHLCDNSTRTYSTDENGYTEFSILFDNHFTHGEVPPVVFNNLTDRHQLKVNVPGASYDQLIGLYTITPIHVDIEVRTNETVLMAVASVSVLIIFALVLNVLWKR